MFPLCFPFTKLSGHLSVALKILVALLCTCSSLHSTCVGPTGQEGYFLWPKEDERNGGLCLGVSLYVLTDVSLPL